MRLNPDSTIRNLLCVVFMRQHRKHQGLNYFLVCYLGFVDNPHLLCYVDFFNCARRSVVFDVKLEEIWQFTTG